MLERNPGALKPVVCCEINLSFFMLLIDWGIDHFSGVSDGISENSKADKQCCHSCCSGKKLWPDAFPLQHTVFN